MKTRVSLKCSENDCRSNLTKTNDEVHVSNLDECKSKILMG